MKAPIRLLSVLSCCTAAMLLAPDAASAAPKRVRVHVQAPFDLNNPGATNLDALEYYGKMAVWGHEFEIPYPAVEALINAKIDAVVPAKVGGVEVCEDPCPDVTWSVRIKPRFKFTRTNQPVLTSLGQSGENRVKIELTTEGRLDVHADVRAETWADTVEVPVDVFVVVGLKAAVEVDLWPTLKVHKPGSSEPGVSLEFSLVDSNIDLDLNGKAAALGAKWGTIIGLSPVGLLVGGPILGPLLAWIGDEGADLAEAAISNLFYAKVEGILNAQSAGLEDMVNDHLLPYIHQANGLRDRLMNTPLPGVDKTVAQLTANLGATVELHTVTPDGVATSAVLRMSGAAGSGKLKGVVRLPKQACEYATVNGGPLKGAVLPLGLVAANQDLAAKVGQACSGLPGAPIVARTYLGASPRAALGAAAQDLPVWKNNAGQSKWTGTMTQTDKWYECGFEVSGLPNAAIVGLDGPTWLTQHHVAVADRRFFAAKVGAQVVLDHHMKPVPGGSLVFGGAGVCGGGGGGGGGIQQSQLDKLKDMLDPEKCPQCGLKRVPGREHVLEISNPQAFLETAAGKQLLRTVEANRAAAGVGAKPAAGVKPGAPVKK